MSQNLIHNPEGDHNPYDAVPWGRQPLHPAADTPIRVGVRAETAVDQVFVEWESDDAGDRQPLDGDDSVWAGEIGPFTTDARYRFVTDEQATEWFHLSVQRWEAHRFSTVRRRHDVIEAACGPLLLTITPNGPQVEWALQVGDGSGGELRASIDGWEASITGGCLQIASDHGSVTIRELAVALEGDDCVTSVRLSWHLETDEHLFGTGERYDNLNQRGRAPDVRVYEQYKGQGTRTYFPLPWVLSSRGYGLRVDSIDRVCFDLGQSQDDIASMDVPTDTASGALYFGTPKEILGAYAADVGRPPALPLWAYGPWMSSNEWDQDTTVREMVERTISEGVPATVVVIEAWSDEATFYLFNDTRYQPVPGDTAVAPGDMTHTGRWPDPKGLIDWLHEHDMRIILWQIPVLKDTTDDQQQDNDIAFAEESGLIVTTANGGTYRNRGWWFPGSRVIDFTNPDAYRWWFDKRAYLVDEYGVDGFKTDGGEHLWGSDVVTNAGEAGDEAANMYPTHYLGSYHQFLSEHGHRNPVTFSRAGFTGSQAYPAHWAGDEDSTWEAFRASLTAGLSAALGGVAFWTWDLAGFSGPLPSAELYMRSTAMAAFSPLMQYHSEHNQHKRPLIDRTPWNVAEQTDDPTVLDTYRFYARLRMNLIPYLDTLGHEASQSGLPLMRPLVLEYPDDPNAVAIDDQFLLGPDILVAPVLEAGARSRRVYIPDGDWFDLWTSSHVQPGWVEAPAPIDKIPIYVRGGAVIPLWLGEELAFGSEVGFPKAGSGRLAAAIFPGDSERRIRHPLTGEVFTIAVRVDSGDLVVETDAAPGIDVWLTTYQGLDGGQTVYRVHPDARLKQELQ